MRSMRHTKRGAGFLLSVRGKLVSTHISQSLSGSSTCLSCLCLLICLRSSCLFGKREKKKKGEEEVKEGKGRYEEEKEETGHKNPLAIAASCSVSFPRFCTIV